MLKLLIAIIMSSIFTAQAAGSERTIVLSGHLASEKADANESVTLEVRFFGSAAGADILPVNAISLPNVPMNTDRFEAPLTLDESDWHTIFNTASEVWLEVRVPARSLTFPRQQLTLAPYALRTPIDSGRLTFDAAGKLTLLTPDQLRFSDGQGKTLTLTAPAASVTPTSVTWPGGTGTNLDLLQANGAGGAAWAAAPAIGGQAVMVSQNLGDLTDMSAARANLGLGNAATRSVGTGAGDVAAGNHTHTMAAFSGHGTLATATSIDASLIDAGAVSDRHVATNAAIAVSKISGRGGAATKNIGTTASDVAAGQHTHAVTAITDRGSLSEKNTVAGSDFAAGALDNAAVAAGAAIEGSKVTPNFGTQDITTSGSVTAASLTLTSSLQLGDSANGCDNGRKGALRFHQSSEKLQFCDGTTWQEATPTVLTGRSPIGAIVSWHKSMSGTPASLPDGWVECNGQTIADASSPYNGVAIPNLNSATQDGSTSSGMFLRGGPTSGIFQADATAPNGLSTSTTALRQTATQLVSSSGSTVAAGGRQNTSGTTTTLNSTDLETRPANMTVVWIMRIK